MREVDEKTDVVRDLLERDKQCVWHPYTQMKDALPNIPIVSGKASLIYDDQGNAIIDAISSWWVNTHGHSHPYIADKVYEQLNCLEHVIFAGFTHPKAVELAERVLRKIGGSQSKVFFSDNGSTAVEVAIKMAFQYWHNQGVAKKKVIAIEGAYHGDTFGAMSVSGRSEFNNVFADWLFDVTYIPFPDENGKDEALKMLNEVLAKGDVASIIIEPLVQGAAGMRMYSPAVLEEMIALCHKHSVLVIADEVMTGFGRTGKMFATDHIKSNPDIVCMSKGLTGGTMALGLTTCSEKIFDAFLSDDVLKTFFHGHSFTANPVACASACASLDLFDEDTTWVNIARIVKQQSTFHERLRTIENVENIRQTGTIIAFELITSGSTSYFNADRNSIYTHFINRGILLRPLGNVIYILPPYCVTENELALIHEEILIFLKQR